MFVPLTTRTGFAALRLQNLTRMRTQLFYLFGFNSIAPTFSKTYTRYVLKKLAGAEGIEPSSAVLETDILPLNYAPETVTTPVGYANSPRQDSTPTQKIKRKYYNVFFNS